jgi:hypothetical protein
VFDGVMSVLRQACKRRCKSGPVERRQLCCCVAE